MPKRTLQTGVAYHSNRMPSHIRADMEQIAKADMDIVVHMFTHNDMERHRRIMKDIVQITADNGLETWIDNWGLFGTCGDKSHFLSYHPEERMYFSDGTPHPIMPCMNSPVYRQFIKDWIDMTAELGAKTIFWDEPCFPRLTFDANNHPGPYACRCSRCQERFQERFGHPMPLEIDDEVDQFRTDTLLDFFGEITAYSASLGLKNAVCVMLAKNIGINLDTLDRISSLPHLDNVGSDPYWYGQKNVSPYEYVYNGAKKNLEIATAAGKDHNVWIQGYAAPAGREEEIIEATTAAYDAGARTIISWGYMGSESNDYGAEIPIRTWQTTVEAMKLIRSVERQRIWEENRKKYMR